MVLGPGRGPEAVGPGYRGMALGLAEARAWLPLGEAPSNRACRGAAGVTGPVY